MKTAAWIGAALALALTTACKDRDRGDLDRTDAGDRVEATGDRAGDQAQKAADETGNAADNAADEVGDAAKDAGNGVEEAAKDVGDEFGATSYERRDEFRHEVDQRLAAMDKEIADLRKGVNDNSTKEYRNGISSVRETRRTVGQDVDRLAGATAATWDELKGKVWTSLDSLDHQLRTLRPDAKPMGGVGPS
jgi:peptidoglycan/xylan/chitin deacetylase (PgdA/CDA1 family)